jgi:hypothetical protein
MGELVMVLIFPARRSDLVTRPFTTPRAGLYEECLQMRHNSIRLILAFAN